MTSVRVLDDEAGEASVPVIDHEERARHSYLAWVSMLHRMAEVAAMNRQHAIDEARLWGMTWAEIGAALGMSRQTAHKHFGQRHPSDL